jgi:hypothetical protein
MFDAEPAHAGTVVDLFLYGAAGDDPPPAIPATT